MIKNDTKNSLEMLQQLMMENFYVLTTMKYLHLSTKYISLSTYICLINLSLSLVVTIKTYENHENLTKTE